MNEQSLILGSENQLVATITNVGQLGSASPRCVALLTNAGVIPRSGPHRMNVHLARRFAEMGIPSVRFDLSGLGDSARSGGTLPIAQQWIVDTRSVMDAAQAQLGSDQFFMVGFCSGAEVAHHVALEDTRMRAIVLWDLYTYPTIQSRLRRMLYRLQRAGTKRLFSKVLSRITSAKHGTTEISSELVESLNPPPREEFAGQVQALVDKGVELHFAFSGGQPEYFNHESQFKTMFSDYQFVHKVAYTYLQVADHVVTCQEAKTAFTDMVAQWLEVRVLPALKPAPALVDGK